MALLKGIVLLPGIFIYILTGLFVKIIFFIPSWRLRIISYWTKIFCNYLRFILKIKVFVEGGKPRLNREGVFIISNHLGYLDGIILGSLFPVIYVSKAEVKKWPLFGWVSEAGSTILIDRKRKSRSPDYIQEAALALKRKLNLLIFPEGTSTCGEKLLPFQSIHFQSCLDAQSQILPVIITYTKINGLKATVENRDKVCWYGQVSFLRHVCGVLGLHSLEAKVAIQPRIEPQDFIKYGSSRKELGHELYGRMAINYPLFRVAPTPSGMVKLSP